MEEVLKAIKSFYWWFSVIIVGILINLFTLFLKPKLDDFISKWSAKKRNKNKGKKLEWEKEIIRIQSDDNYKNYLHSKMIHNTAFVAGCMCFSILFIIMMGMLPETRIVLRGVVAGLNLLCLFAATSYLFPIIKIHRKFTAASQ